MSLSINTMPAVSPSNGLSASAAGPKGGRSGVPFDAMLDDQTDANGDEVGEVCDAGLPRDRPSAGAAAGPATTQTPIDPLAGLRSRFGIRRLLSGNDDIAESVAALTALGKDKSGNDSVSLWLLAAQGVLHQLESLQALRQAGDAESNEANSRSGPALDDQLPQNLLASLVDAEAALPDDASDATLPMTTESAALLADLLKESSEAAQTDQTRALDVRFSRPPSLPPGLALVEAIRLSTGQETFADQDKDFNQPPTSMGFDRRSSKSATVAAIHLADGVAGLGSAVRASTPSTVAAAAPLPNEAGVVSSIVQSMRLQMRDGIGTAIVHLEPDYLGAVSIALRVENGVVTASLHAENSQVRAWMEANESLLRENLAGQGLSLDRLLVTDERIGEERSPDRRHQQEQEQHARQRPRRDDTTTFEVVV